jgi:hypothetical protein
MGFPSSGRQHGPVVSLPFGLGDAHSARQCIRCIGGGKQQTKTAIEPAAPCSRWHSQKLYGGLKELGPSPYRCVLSNGVGLQARMPRDAIEAKPNCFRRKAAMNARIRRLWQMGRFLCITSACERSRKQAANLASLRPNRSEMHYGHRTSQAGLMSPQPELAFEYLLQSVAVWRGPWHRTTPALALQGADCSPMAGNPWHQGHVRGGSPRDRVATDPPNQGICNSNHLDPPVPC